MSKAAFCSLFAVSLAIGLGFRFVRLDLRPMHHDEANEAVKSGKLLETGEYRYDRRDHHGPTLYYLAAVSAWSRGQKSLASLDERTLRAVPAIFGASLPLLFCMLAEHLGRAPVAFSALLAALSPALTYYSRFFIQESLLAFFALGFLAALGRYACAPRAGWALCAGAFAGLAYATKETAIILILAAAVACGTAEKWTFKSKAGRFLAFRCAHLIWAITAAALVALVFYTSFFRNPSGIFESVRAFSVYFERGIEPGSHDQPWDYYLRILALSRAEGLVWTEGLVLALGLAALLFAFGAFGNLSKKGVSEAALFGVRAIACYSLLSAAVFSLVRYKTPWNLINFHAGFALLAGCGAWLLVRHFTNRTCRMLLISAMLGAVWHLGLQNWRANFRYPADPRNPYVYAQTSPDYLRMVRRIGELAALHPDGTDMLIKVIAPPTDQWPLPWCIRNMRRVGYWSKWTEAGRFDDVPVIVASQENAEALESALPRHVSEHYGLRPGALLTLFVERALWERFLSSRR